MSLTDAEHQAMELTADLWNLLARSVVGDGPTRDGDMSELALHVHAIQNMILAQSAARQHPDMYRLMGGEPIRVVSGGSHE